MGRAGADGGEVGGAPVPVLHKIGVNKAVVGRRVLGEAGQVAILAVEVDGDVKGGHIPVGMRVELTLNAVMEKIANDEKSTPKQKVQRLGPGEKGGKLGTVKPVEGVPVDVIRKGVGPNEG